MIVKIDNKKQLKQFIYFPKTLYKNEKNYVMPFFSVQIKELTQLVLKDRSYHALIYLNENKVLGRILYTFKIDKNGQKKCYFSFFDFINDIEVAKSLIDKMQCHANNCGYTCLEGPYCPYDPDTRRGILTNCFDKLPSVFLSYNYPYYVDIYEKLGFNKVTDTYSVSVDVTQKAYKKAEKISNIFSTDKIQYNYLNRKKIKDEIQAIFDIMKESSTEINYESPPTYQMIESIFNDMKFFLKDEYVVIAREKETLKAVGFAVCIPELNQIFCKFNGKFNIFTYLKNKNKINKVRGWLQYVIPKYQKTFLLCSLFNQVGKSMQKNGIIEFEAGTIVEDNKASYKAFEHFGGYIDKIYRIYQRG